jgi:hypothetical protein
MDGTDDTPEQLLDFRSRNRVMQELVGELDWLRKHNLQYKPGEPQTGMLLHAEASLTLLVLEHFLQIIVSKPEGSLPNLLKQAVDQGLLRVENLKNICNELGKIRGAWQHGNFEQRARQLKMDVSTYFGQRFAKEIEELYKFAQFIVRQIDHRTGRPFVELPPPPVDLADPVALTAGDWKFIIAAD